MPKTCHHRPVTSSQYDGEAVEVGSRGDNGDTLKNIHSKVESPKPAIITLLRLPNMAEKWWSLGDKGGNGDTLKKYAGKSRKPKSPYTRTTIVYIYIYTNYTIHYFTLQTEACGKTFQVSTLNRILKGRGRNVYSLCYLWQIQYAIH